MKLIIKLFVAVCLLFVTIISLRAQAPDWVWAKAGAGTIDDIVTGMTIDKDENIILTGFFYGSSITFGTTTLTGAGHFDMFIVKYDANGNVLWAKSAGGANADNGSSITVDADGNIYVAGRIGSQPFAFDSIILTSAGNLFIVKCDPVGNVLWAKSASGVKNAETPEIIIDSSGNLYLTGSFTNTVTFGTTTLNSNNTNLFIAKYDSLGNVLWAKSAAKANLGNAFGIDVDINGNIYTGGAFISTTIDFGAITLTNTSSNYQDVFIAKYDANGNVLWAKSAGGTLSDIIVDISIDADGNLYVTGYFFSTSITFDNITLNNEGGLFCSNAECPDLFIVKYDTSGNVLWAKSEGAKRNVLSFEIHHDEKGNSYITGEFYGPSIIFGSDTLINNDTIYNTSDLFVVKYDTSGNELWAKSTGGNGVDGGHSIVTDESGDNIYVSGKFNSNSIIIGADTLINLSNMDIFLAKLSNTVVDIRNKNDIDNAIKIYPNPTTGQFTISLTEAGNYNVEVYNTIGQVMYAATLTNANSHSINLGNVASGIYTAVIRNNQGSYKKLLIKE